LKGLKPFLLDFVYFRVSTAWFVVCVLVCWFWEPSPTWKGRSQVRVLEGADRWVLPFSRNHTKNYYDTRSPNSSADWKDSIFTWLRLNGRKWPKWPKEPFIQRQTLLPAFQWTHTSSLEFFVIQFYSSASNFILFRASVSSSFPPILCFIHLSIRTLTDVVSIFREKISAVNGFS
jgi:hypothetical protein